MENSGTSEGMDFLDLTLQKLAETRARYPENDKTKVIRGQLDDIVCETVSDLSHKYRLFKGAKVREGGSMTDGTKIGSPDEFDYLVQVPALQEHLVTLKGNQPFFADDYSIEMQSTKLFLKTQDDSFLDDILCPEWCDEEENRIRKNDQLLFKGDICLVVEIPYRSTSRSVSLMLLFEFSSIDTINISRRSVSEWENTKLKELEVDSVEKQCYRLLKYLSQTFLESKLDMYSFEYKAVIETYTWKTMFLKVLCDSQERWSAQQLGTKVLEILCLIRDDMRQLVKEKSGDNRVLCPLLVSSRYNLHPVSAEPALFSRSKVSNYNRKAWKEPIFSRSKAIEKQVETLIDLLLMVKHTEDGARHFFAILESIDEVKSLLKVEIFQESVMECLKERNDVSGIYNNFLLIWDVTNREEFKSFLRASKFGIIVHPKGKKDDCVVFPKSFSVLNCLQCGLFQQADDESNTVEVLEMDVFDTKQVVCWNVNENVDLYSFIKSAKCNACYPVKEDDSSCDPATELTIECE